jgi:hypothetical protein
MTVKELQEYLDQCDETLEVFIGNIDCYKMILYDFQIYQINQDDVDAIAFSVDNIQQFLN